MAEDFDPKKIARLADLDQHITGVENISTLLCAFYNHCTENGEMPDSLARDLTTELLYILCGKPRSNF